METTEEIWKPVSGYEGYYEVSTHGRVKSLNRVHIRKNGVPLTVREKILKVSPNADGYPQVSLCNGQDTLYHVHVLVANAFIPKTDGLNTVDHLDANRCNNRIENLERVSHRENIQRCFWKGHVIRKLSPNDVRKIRTLRGVIKINEIADHYHVTVELIRSIFSGKSWSHLT